MHAGKRLIGGGYESCGWLGCAVCGRAIRARRAAEIIVSAHRWCQATPARRLIMLTLSPPHHRGDKLADTYKRLDLVWRQCQKKSTLGRSWREQWWIRHQWVSWEATVAGGAGDHPHLHVLLYLSTPADPDELAADLLARLHITAFRAERRGHPELAEALDGWTLAGCQAVDAGPSAGLYIGKVTEGLDDDEMAELVGLGLELTDIAVAKEGRGGLSVPVTAVSAVIARRAHDGGMRPRYWLDHDEVSGRLAAGLRGWREVTFGRPVLYPDRALRHELLPDFADLTDEEIVSSAQELEAFDRAKVAEVMGGGKVVLLAPEQRSDLSAADSLPTEEDDNRRPFRVARPVLDAWADQAHDERDESQPGAWGGPEGALCRLLERAGPWRAASVLSWAWQRASGRPATVWRHERTGRLRVGPEYDFVFDEWVEVDDAEVQGQCGWPVAA